MARKIDPNAKPAPASAPADDVDTSDLAILHPDVTLTLADREVTVREYRFIDGMRARAKGKPLIDDLKTFVDNKAVIEASTEDYLDLLAKHGDLVRELMADSIEGADADWINGLDADDGDQLLLTWWAVCGRFFVRRVLAGMREKLIQSLMQAASAGATSSPASPAPATAPSTVSAPGTPSVN